MHAWIRAQLGRAGGPPPEALQRLTVRGAPSLRLCPESSHCRGLPGRSDSALRPAVVPALLRLSFPEVRPGAPQGEPVSFRTISVTFCISGMVALHFLMCSVLKTIVYIFYLNF